jgi:hypothetical protein
LELYVYVKVDTPAAIDLVAYVFLSKRPIHEAGELDSCITSRTLTINIR